MRVFLPFIVLVATPAYAAPAYLQCSFDVPGKDRFILAVTADEANGAVTTLATTTGFSERRTAVFSPTSVKWSSPMRFGGLRYDLSRTDLTLTRELVIGERVTSEVAACKIQETPKRAF